MLAEAFNYYWRILVTAISFLVFGIGGLTFQVILPLLIILVWNRQRRINSARWLIHNGFKLFVGMMHRIGVMTYEVHGLEKLDRRGLLILANHPSLIDVVILMSLVKYPDCVVKAGLWSNLFTQAPVRAAGFISNATGADLIERCIQSVQSGNNLIIFPEGTRTPRSGKMQFQRGAANIAIRGTINVTPVVIRNNPQLLAKGDTWYRVPVRKPHFEILIQDDIRVTPFIEKTAEPTLAVRDYTNHLHHYFSQEVSRNGCA